MPFLFWRLIEESKVSGAEQIDFGRSDLEHRSLVSFKDKFGTTRESLTYYRYCGSAAKRAWNRWNYHVSHRLFPVLPDAIFVSRWWILYRHWG